MKFLAILIPAALILSAAKLNGPAQPEVVAHEWGTFTSIAGDDGRALAWAPLFGAPDLPCFVSRMNNGNRPKWELEGLVRMETPVLYFYAQHPATLDVHVGFPRGVISE